MIFNINVAQTKIFNSVSSRSRSISPMKQVDGSKDKPRKPGAPIINGKNSLQANRDFPKLRTKSESSSNLQFSGTNSHPSKNQISLIQKPNLSRDRIRSQSNDTTTNNSYKRSQLPSNRSSTDTTSGTSTADIISSTSNPSRMGINLNLRTKMPPITGTLNPKRNGYTSKGSSHKSSKTKAQTIKIDQTEDVSVVRKKTYTITENSLKQQDKNEKEEKEADEDTNEQSEDDAKSNVTYKIR